MLKGYLKRAQIKKYYKIIKILDKECLKNKLTNENKQFKDIKKNII